MFFNNNNNNINFINTFKFLSEFKGKNVIESILDIRVCALADVVPRFVEGTVQTSAEIQKARLTNELLRQRAFYTANFGLYDIEKENKPTIHNAEGEAYLYFGGRENNPIFSNLTEACRQLIMKGDYVPPAKAAVQAKKSALRVKVGDLELQMLNDNDKTPYYEIKTSDYNALNPAQRALAEEVHGKGKQFVDVMKILADTGIETIKIYVLNSEYVKKHAIEKAICRASWLNFFKFNSFFLAGDRSVNYYLTMYGVLRDS